MIPNKTPWVDRILNKYYDAIESVAPDGCLPEIDAKKGERRIFAEHGCGHYGCVIPVQRADVVFKVTTDAAEAAFVRAAIEIGNWPDGIVRYHSIYQLAGASHRKRPVFVLWRQEAFDLGFLTKQSRWVGPQSADYDRRMAQQAINMVNVAQLAADQTRRWTARKGPEAISLDSINRARSRLDWGKVQDVPDVRTVLERERGEYRAALAFAYYDRTVQLMQGNPVVYEVGTAMYEYLASNILLADVHLNNIGKNEDGVALITDPGHAVFLDNEYDSLTIPELGA